MKYLVLPVKWGLGAPGEPSSSGLVWSAGKGDGEGSCCLNDELNSDVMWVGYINTLKIRQKVHLLDCFLKEERNVSIFFIFTKPLKAKTGKSSLQHSPTVSIARLLASCSVVQIGMSSCHLPPDTGDAELIQARQLEAWCRWRDTSRLHLWLISTCHYFGCLRC